MFRLLPDGLLRTVNKGIAFMGWMEKMIATAGQKVNFSLGNDQGIGGRVADCFMEKRGGTRETGNTPGTNI